MRATSPPSGASPVCPPELKVRTPAHAKYPGWYVEFESRVTHCISNITCRLIILLPLRAPQRIPHRTCLTQMCTHTASTDRHGEPSLGGEHRPATARQPAGPALPSQPADKLPRPCRHHRRRQHHRPLPLPGLRRLLLRLRRCGRRDRRPQPPLTVQLPTPPALPRPGFPGCLPPDRFHDLWCLVAQHASL